MAEAPADDNAGVGSPAGMFHVKHLECWLTRWRMAAIRGLVGDHERVLENGDPALKSEHADRPRANAGSVASRIARPSGGASSLGGHCQTAPPPGPSGDSSKTAPPPGPGVAGPHVRDALVSRETGAYRGGGANVLPILPGIPSASGARAAS